MEGNTLMKICSKCGATRPDKMFKDGYICVSCVPKTKVNKINKVISLIKRLIK